MIDPLMNSKIGHIQPLMPNSILKPENLEKFRGDETQPFSDVLKDSINSINNLQKNANTQVEKLAKGEIKDVHQVMVAMQEANLTFKLMMKVRTQILAAYKEISKGQ